MALEEVVLASSGCISATSQRQEEETKYKSTPAGEASFGSLCGPPSIVICLSLKPRLEMLSGCGDARRADGGCGDTGRADGGYD